MKQNHKFLSLKKKYGRYTIHMTQHIFVEVGLKRYGPVNWIIFIDEHIVLNTYIKDRKVKITEDFLDEHWNIFVVKYNYKIDVWSMVEEKNIEEFNDYKESLLPDKSDITLNDFDDAMAKVKVSENKQKRLYRRVGKMTDKLFELKENMEVIIREMDEFRNKKRK